MLDKPQYLTAEGRRKLEEELHHLRVVRIPQVAASLKEAIGEGDLSENAGYSESKREQGFVVGRIQTIENLLNNAQELADAVRTDRVTLGSRVTIIEEGNPPETYHIVGGAEANPRAGRISHESPLGRALIGHQVGEKVETITPGGLLRIRISALE